MHINYPKRCQRQILCHHPQIPRCHVKEPQKYSEIPRKHSHIQKVSLYKIQKGGTEYVPPTEYAQMTSHHQQHLIQDGVYDIGFRYTHHPANYTEKQAPPHLTRPGDLLKARGDKPLHGDSQRPTGWKVSLALTQN